jgi:hypothetical protein
MRLAPALENEKLREDRESWNKIFLHREGKFFHAYDWSAWLIKTCICTEEFQKERGDETILAANRYITKKGEYVSVGFPIESLSKYMPEYESIVADNGEYATVFVDLGDLSGVSYEEIAGKFDEWKQSCPIKEVKPKGGARQQNALYAPPGGKGIFQIVSQIISYPLEAKTPLESVEFLRQMRSDLIALL